MAQKRGRLVYTEPNLYAAEEAGVKFGNGKTATDIFWNPEDLNISVDLRVVVPNRSDCGEVIQNFPVTFSNGLGTYTSFLQGSYIDKNSNKHGNYLTTNYTEASYSEIKSNNVSTTESLGISSIDIRFDAHFYPQVTMKFTDVRGYSLFMPAEEEYVNELQDSAYRAGHTDQPGRPYTNLFKAVFHFPYPQFLLTIKGFYGNKVTFILAVNDFKTALNGQNGNFDVTISFIGYMFGLYTDIPMNYILVAPYLDSQDGMLTPSSYWNQQKTRFISKAANSSGEGENTTQPIPTFLELARKYAELDIQSDDISGTETEEYYTIQTAYNDLSSIIDSYKELVKNFGVTDKIYDVNAKTKKWNIYLTTYNGEYSWDKSGLAEEVYQKIKQYKEKYDGISELGNAVIEYPFLTRCFKDNTSPKIDIKKMATVTGDEHGTNFIDDSKPNNSNKPIIISSNGYDHSTMIVDGSTIFIDGKDELTLNAVNDEDFNKVLEKIVKENKNTQYKVIAFPGEYWIENATNSLKYIKNVRDEKLKKAAKSAAETYSEKLGYALTIENVFRMLFAHIECFFYYYFKNTISEIKKSKRTFEDYGLEVEETDSDGIATTKKSFLPPFPALYDSKQRKAFGAEELTYPGSVPTAKDMLEVSLVDKIFKAAKMTGKEVKEIEEILKEQFNVENKNELEKIEPYEINAFPFPISFDNSFIPLSLFDSFNDSNNPYIKIIENVKENQSFSKIDEILYFAYVRYCSYKLTTIERAVTETETAMTGGLMTTPVNYTKITTNYHEKYFIAAETENIKRAFERLNSLERFNIKTLSKCNDKEFSNYLDNIKKRRIQEQFSVQSSQYNKPVIFSTSFNTSQYNTNSDIDKISKYLLDDLQGTYVLSESTFDVFKKMNEVSVEIKTDLEYFFKKLNKIYDFRDSVSDESKIVGGSSVGLNTVYHLDSNKESSVFHANANGGFTVFRVKDEEVSFNINEIIDDTHSSKKSYLDLVKQKRTRYDDYVGLYSPSVVILDGSELKNLFLTKFFWDDKQSKEAKAFLLLSALIGSSDNQFLFDDKTDLTKIGVNAYRLRKLSVLYYGALIYRLRHQMLTLDKETNSDTYVGFDLVSMEDNNDTFGINKDIFNEYTYSNKIPESPYVKRGVYYYPNDLSDISKRKFTKDAPILSLLSSKNPSTYAVFSKGNKNGNLYNKIINVLSTSYGPGVFKMENELKDSLTTLLDACDYQRYDNQNTFGLESYFLTWVNTDFSSFLDLLKNDYISFDQDKNPKPISDKWFKITGINGDKNKFVQGFEYDEKETSANMFLNRLQCDQATVLVCVPIQDTGDKTDGNTDEFNEKSSKIIHSLFKELNDYYSSQEGEDEDENNSSDVSVVDIDIHKSMYYTLKSLYDKWIYAYGNFDRFLLPSPIEEQKVKKRRHESGYTEEENVKELNNFLFVDTFYNDISDKFYCNPKLLYDMVMDCFKGDRNWSVFQFMSKLAQDNKLLMVALPVYNNFYNIDTINNIFTPHFDYDCSNKNSYGNTYLLMYTNGGSKHLNEELKTETGYGDDGFDLADTLGHANKLDAYFTSGGEEVINIPVPAFGVTYGMQNQQYFKGMNINMDSPMTTDYSIVNTLILSQTGAKGDKNFPMGIGQNIYSLYSNRSYTITVEMMGCANIMPMMYFQLNNVPMFKGAYMIVSVSHSIKAGTMTTTFTGIRQSKYVYPEVTTNIMLTDVVDRINKSYDKTKVENRRNLKIDYVHVDGKPFTDNINIEFKNALGHDYVWSRNVKGSMYPYAHRDKEPQYIVLHYAVTTSSKTGRGGRLLKGWVDKWNLDGDGASADFAVDDGNIYQFTPDIRNWYASYCNGGPHNADGRGGKTQYNTAHVRGIGIEMCSSIKDQSTSGVSNHDGWYFTEAVLENTSLLCAHLIEYFPNSMPCSKREDLDNILSTHYLVSGKQCPGVKGWNNGDWKNPDGTPVKDDNGKQVYNDMKEFNKFKDRVWKKLSELRKK